MTYMQLYKCLLTFVVMVVHVISGINEGSAHFHLLGSSSLGVSLTRGGQYILTIGLGFFRVALSWTITAATSSELP